MASCYIISVHVNFSFLESYGFFFLFLSILWRNILIRKIVASFYWVEENVDERSMGRTLSCTSQASVLRMIGLAFKVKNEIG